MAMAFSSIDRQGLLVVWDPVGPGLAVLGMLAFFLFCFFPKVCHSPDFFLLFPLVEPSKKQQPVMRTLPS